jgi:hypothetical protein
MADAQATDDGVTVILTGYQTTRAAELIEDQLVDFAGNLLGDIEGGLLDLSAGREVLGTAIERLFDLKGWLELLEYGHADGPIEMPLSVLFPPPHDAVEGGES